MDQAKINLQMHPNIMVFQCISYLYYICEQSMDHSAVSFLHERCLLLLLNLEHLPLIHIQSQLGKQPIVLNEVTRLTNQFRYQQSATHQG